MVKIKFVIMVAVIIFLGIILATGFASNNKTIVPKESGAEVVPSPLEARTDAMMATASPEVTPEKLYVEALACTILSTSSYEVDLRMKNTGTETVTVTIYPPNRKVELPSGETRRMDILIPYEKGILNLVADEGEKLEIQIPPCVSRGGSGTSGRVGLTDNQVTPVDTTPSPSTPPPTEIPEFPWIGFPIVSVIFLMLFLRKK